MSRVTRDIRMFGDPVTITANMNAAGSVTEVTAARGTQRCKELVGSVNRALAAGKPLVGQLHTLTMLQDLIHELLNIEEAHETPEESEQPKLRVVK